MHRWPRKRTLAVAGVLAAVLGVATWRQSNQCLNLGGLQGKTEVDVRSKGARLSRGCASCGCGGVGCGRMGGGLSMRFDDAANA